MLWNNGNNFERPRESRGKFYIEKQSLDWYGNVSQYKISLKTPLVFQNYSCYFITPLNNPRYSGVNS